MEEEEDQDQEQEYGEEPHEEDEPTATHEECEEEDDEGDLSALFSLEERRPRGYGRKPAYTRILEYGSLSGALIGKNISPVPLRGGCVTWNHEVSVRGKCVKGIPRDERVCFPSGSKVEPPRETGGRM